MSQEIENQSTKKNFASQSTRTRRGPGRPRVDDPLVYLQTGFAPDIYRKLQYTAKKKGINESDIIRLLVANAMENITL